MGLLVSMGIHDGLLSLLVTLHLRACAHVYMGNTGESTARTEIQKGLRQGWFLAPFFSPHS